MRGVSQTLDRGSAARRMVMRYQGDEVTVKSRYTHVYAHEAADGASCRRKEHPYQLCAWTLAGRRTPPLTSNRSGQLKNFTSGCRRAARVAGSATALLVPESGIKPGA
jgi:hypothetical protein